MKNANTNNIRIYEKNHIQFLDMVVAKDREKKLIALCVREMTGYFGDFSEILEDEIYAKAGLERLK
jgi:hypothetical protein